MHESKTRIPPIRLHLDGADADASADHRTLQARFAALVVVFDGASRPHIDSAGTTRLMAIAGDFLSVMQSLDAQYGNDGELPMDDIGEAVDEALRALAELDALLDRGEISAQRENLHALQIGMGYWAMRHHIPMYATEPVVNALAAQANRANTRQDAAAVYALMQGFVQHFAPQLQADLERSNPERPWRLLNLNFAIASIRTGDAAMMRFAFDTLNMHLPEECAGFYEEASALAAQPGFPLETRGMIEAECAKWAKSH